MAEDRAGLQEQLFCALKNPAVGCVCVGKTKPKQLTV